MTTSTFYTAASADDGYVQSEGQVDVQTWAQVQDGYGVTATVTQTTDMTRCQNYKSGNKYYWRIRVGAIRWNTASIPDSDSITSATFAVYATNETWEIDPTQSIRVYDWGTLGAEDWRDPTEYAALTEVASAEIDGFTDSAYNDFTSTGSAPASVNKTGYSYYMVFPVSFTGSAPVYPDQDMLGWTPYDSGSNYPRLTVVHESGGLSAQPPLLTASPTLYTPTKVISTRKAEPGLITATPTTPTPTKVTSTRKAEPGLLTLTPTVLVPANVYESQSVGPGLLTATPTVPTPAKVYSTRTAEPPVLVAASSVLAPEAVPGGIDAEPGVITATPTVYAPSVHMPKAEPPVLTATPSALIPSKVISTRTAEPGVLTATPSTLTPAKVYSTRTAEPGLLTATPTLYAPTTHQSSAAPPVVTLSPSVLTPSTHQSSADVPLLEASPAVLTPAKVISTRTAEPGLLVLSSSVLTPTQVSEAGGPLTAYPPLLEAAPSVLTPSKVISTRTAEPPLLVATSAVLAPSTHMSKAVAPLLEATPTVLVPDIAQTAHAPLLTATPSVPVPTVLPGGVTVEPGLITATPAVQSPEVMPGGVAIEAGLLSLSPSVLTPARAWQSAVGVPLLVASSSVLTPSTHMPLAVAPLLTATPSLYIPTVTMGLSAAPPLLEASPVLYDVALLQTASPDADITDGSWTNEVGSQTDLYASIDEDTPSDADYCKSAASPSTDMMEVSLESLQDPQVSTFHKVAYRIGRDSEDETIDITVRLMCGTTTIATWIHYAVAEGWTDYEQTLTTEQADAITDYTDLRLRVEADS